MLGVGGGLWLGLGLGTQIAYRIRSEFSKTEVNHNLRFSEFSKTQWNKLEKSNPNYTPYPSWPSAAQGTYSYS